MKLMEIINRDLRKAMKAKDSAKLRGVRAIKAALLLAQTDGSGKELDENAEIKILQKLVKQRKESKKIYEDQQRGDLAKIEAEEIEIISSYLPDPLSDNELGSKLQEIVDRLGASSMKDMGRVMSTASAELAGKAEGQKIANIVKELLK